MLLNHVRTVDPARLLRRLGSLSAKAMARVDRALIISLGLVSLEPNALPSHRPGGRRMAHVRSVASNRASATSSLNAPIDFGR